MISNCIGMFRIARNHPKKYLVCQKPLKAYSGNVSLQRHLAPFSENFDCLQKESECQKGLHWLIVPVPLQFVLCILCFVFVNVFYMFFFLKMLVLILNGLSNALFAAVHSAGKMCRNVFKSTAVTQAQ